MILELLAALGDSSGGLFGLGALSARAGLAAVVAFAFALLSGPRLLSWLRARHYIENETLTDSAELNRLNADKGPVPTMGGLMIVGSIFVAAILCADLHNLYVQFALLSTLGYGLIGFVDDWIKLTHPGRKGLAAWGKSVLQFMIAVSVAVGMTMVFRRLGTELPARYPADYSPELMGDLLALHVPLTDWSLDLSVWGGVFHGLLVLLVVTGSSNAVNLTDGMDGLAAGAMTVAALAMAVVCVVVGRAHELAPDTILYSPHSQELAVFCTSMAGATLGFLWFNAAPALLYMGDTGSLPLGSLLGFVAVAVKQELLLLLIGGVFVLETLSVILQVGVFKASGGRRVFRCAPLHHHFQFRGMPDTRIVVRFWIFSVVCAAAGLGTLALQAN